MPARATILLAEDDPNDVLLLKKALRAIGLFNPVHVVNDGSEAIEYLKGVIEAKATGCSLPLLILLDLEMPTVGGLKVLEWINSRSALRDIPVAVITGSDQSPAMHRAFSLGASSYLVKPTEFKALVDILRQIKRLIEDVEQDARPFSISPANCVGDSQPSG